MQFFNYEECEKIKESALYQNRLKELKVWLGAENNISSTIAVLLDSNIYDPLKIIEEWGFQTKSLQVNTLPIIHPEQPVPLKWLVLDMVFSIDEQILELLLLISIYETREWRNGNDRYGVSVCLWSKNPNTTNKDSIYYYTKLGRIYLAVGNNKKYKNHYLRYWDSRVFLHLGGVLNSNQYLIYRYYLMPCVYMQHNLLWKINQDKDDSVSNDKKIFIEKFINSKKYSNLKIDYIQKNSLKKIRLINHCLVLAYKYRDKLFTPNLLDSNEIINLISNFVEMSISQGIKDLKDQYVWVLLSLTVHPNFYMHEKVKIANKKKSLGFIEKMKTIDDKDWDEIRKIDCI